MDPSPWSAYTQHYSRLGGAGGAPQPSDLAHPSSRQDPLASYGSPTHSLLLPAHPALNPADPSFNAMGLLSSGYESPMLPFQHSQKGNFASLAQGSTFFKSVNKDDLSDLRGGFRGAHSAQEASSGTLFDSPVASGSWRHPNMPQASCGPFGILPHEAVMSRNSDRNGDKFGQHSVPTSRPSRTSLSFDVQDRTGYGGILPSPSRPPSSFVDPNNTVPHSASLTTQGGDSYFGDSYYCSKSSFDSYGSSSLATSSSSPVDSQSAFPHAYGLDKDDSKAAAMEGAFSANTSVIVSHLHMQNGGQQQPPPPSRPGVISSAGSACQTSPSIPYYQYPSPSSQSPQNLSCTQTYSQQPSPAVLHSPYPAMNTPAPASTPAHVTPPTSIGQAYVPSSSSMMGEGSSPHCAPSSVITSNSANYSVGSDRSTPGSGKGHFVGMATSDLHEDMVDALVGEDGKLLDSELSAMNAMVEKTRMTDSIMDRRMEMYEGHPEMQMVFDDVGMKDGMMMQQSHYHNTPPGGGVIHNNYQPAPVVRKRGRPKGSVNKRAGTKRGTRRGGRRGAAYQAESGRELSLQQQQQQQAQQHQQPPPSGCSPRLNVVRGLHGRILTTGARKNSMTTATSLCDMDFNPASYEQSMGQSGHFTLRDLRRQNEESYHHTGMSLDSRLDSNVFNFEDHSDQMSPYGKMDHQQHPHHQHHHPDGGGGLLGHRGRSPAYRDVKYMHDPGAMQPKGGMDYAHMEQMGMHGQHHPADQQQQQVCDGSSNKSKNFLSIEDDLGFLAELPPIDTDGIAGDGHGNKTSSKEPGGGFLQSFLSFIEGTNEPPVVMPHSEAAVGPQTVGRGRGRGSGAGANGRVGRRGRGGCRGRPPLRRKSDVTYCSRPEGDALPPLHHRPTEHFQPSVTLPNKPKREIEEAANEKEGNNSEFLSDCAAAGLQKDVMVPNPEAPTFSSDEEDAPDRGIADSVAFVIRRLSEDEPPPSGENASVKKNNHQHHETAKSEPSTRTVPTVTIYKRRGRKSKTREDRNVVNNNSESDVGNNGDVVRGSADLDNSTGYDSYEFCEASTRRTSMRRCKEEVMKRRRERITKKRKQNGEEGGGSSQDEWDNMSDDPAWTPSSKNPAADGLKPVTTFHERKRHSKKSRKKLGVIHLMKDGRVYTKVARDHQPKQADDKSKAQDESTKDEDGLCECHFRLGDFVMAVAESENRNPPIWQIEGKNLLQRFEPFEEDGRVLYRNASSYSAWNPSVRSRYRGVTVRLLYSSRAYTIAEYVGLSQVHEEDTINGDVADNAEAHPQQENFEVFLQTLISQVLDPNFIAEIIKENDEYFLSHLQGIEELTRQKKSSLLDSGGDPNLQECAQLYPCLNLVARDLQENCQVCGMVAAQQTVQFHGQLYDQVTLGNKGCSPQNRETSFCVCTACSHTVVLFHRLHHHKYNFILKCRTKVSTVKSEDKESHVILEECLQDTPWVNEMFHEMQAMWNACDKPR